MAQHDYLIDNGSGAVVRSDINNVLDAVATNNSGTTEPAVTHSFQWWADTTSDLLKQRNEANNGWIVRGSLSSEIIPNFESTGIDDNATSTAITIDASENVGIGTSSPSAWQVNNRAIQLFSGYASISGNSSAGACDLAGNAYNTSSAADSGWKYVNTFGASLHQQVGGTHKFLVAPSGTAGAAISWTNAMTIDNSGNVFVGTATVDGINGLSIKPSTYATSLVFNAGATANTLMDFKYYGTTVGKITTTNTSTSYNTSSDYRLKENVTPMIDATAAVKLLKPCNFDCHA